MEKLLISSLTATALLSFGAAHAGALLCPQASPNLVNHVPVGWTVSFSSGHGAGHIYLGDAVIEQSNHIVACDYYKKHAGPGIVAAFELSRNNPAQPIGHNWIREDWSGGIVVYKCGGVNSKFQINKITPQQCPFQSLS